MTYDDKEFDNSDTDWLAQSVYGYGFGYTQKQALYSMLAHIRYVDTELEVHFIEHVGEVYHGPTGWSAEEFVSGETVTLRADVLEEARVAACEAYLLAEELLDAPMESEPIEDE